MSQLSHKRQHIVPVSYGRRSDSAAADAAARGRVVAVVLGGFIVLAGVMFGGCASDASGSADSNAADVPRAGAAELTSPHTRGVGSTSPLTSPDHPPESVAVGASALSESTATIVPSDDPAASATERTEPLGTVTAEPDDPASATDTPNLAPPNTGIADAIHITVPPVPVEIAPAVDVGEIADFGDGLTARVAGYEAVEVTTVLPGEIGGPVLQIDLEFSNRSAAPVDLGAVIVNVEFGESIPAIEITTEPADPPTGTLAPDSAVTGRYVFNVPPQHRSDVHLYVTYSSTAPIVEISGSFAS